MRRSPRSCAVDGAGECQVISLRVCVFTRFRLRRHLAVCGHRSRKAAARPHRFHALFSHLFPYPLQLASLPPALLLPLFFFFFRSIARSGGSPRQTSSCAGSRRRPAEEWTCCVSASPDGVGFDPRQRVWLGVDGEGRACRRRHKTWGVC